MPRHAAPSPPHSPYPLRLTWRRFALRQIIFNQVTGGIGMLSQPVIEAVSPHQLVTHDGLYIFIWTELIVLIGLLTNGTAGMLTMRHGWRHLHDAQARHDQVGFFAALPATARWRLVLAITMSTMLSTWIAQQAFVALQASPWGIAHLDQAPPAGSATLLNMLIGVVTAYAFEYLHDRWTHHEARERMARRLTTDAQLQLLRAQLDPHMLFNTLSNLYGLIDENPPQARAMLLHLIGFLRTTLEGSRTSQHSLADEFNLASDYLSLMQIRMGERLRPSLSLPEALRALPVPAMLLQPLIENAIKHGLEPRRQGGELSVAATQEADQLVLRVRNSGTHRPSHTEIKSSGFGLHSVKDRLALLYGSGEHVELAHLPDQDATEVTLRLPMNFQKSPA